MFSLGQRSLPGHRAPLVLHFLETWECVSLRNLETVHHGGKLPKSWGEMCPRHSLSHNHSVTVPGPLPVKQAGAVGQPRQGARAAAASTAGPRRPPGEQMPARPCWTSTSGPSEAGFTGIQKSRGPGEVTGAFTNHLEVLPLIVMDSSRLSSSETSSGGSGHGSEGRAHLVLLGVLRLPQPHTPSEG